MKVLVTGATGFLGSAIVRRFIAENDEVHALVRDDVGARTVEALGARSHRGTIADPNEVAQAAAGCEVAVHAAGLSSTHASTAALRWVHVAGTENVIQACRHRAVRRVVHLSCADVTLANCDRVHWNEDRRVDDDLVGAFARTKMLAEDLALAAGDKEMEVTAIRPALVWGPGDRGELPRICKEALAKGGIELIGDGKNLIATTYVDLVADAVVAASEALDVAGQAFYVTDAEFLEAGEFFGDLSRAAGLPTPRRGRGYTLAYALAWWRERRGAPGLWRTDVVRRGRSTQFDVGRAARVLEVDATVTVAQGMERLAAWVREQGGPEALAKAARRPETDAAVDAQRAAASEAD